LGSCHDARVTPDALGAEDLERLAIFPLPEAALFPHTHLPLHVFEPRYRALVEHALAGRRVLAVARLKPGYEAVYAARPPVFDTCGAGVIVEHFAHPDGRYHIGLRGLARVRILAELPPELPYRLVRAQIVPDVAVNPALASALQTQIKTLWGALSPTLPESLRDLAQVTENAHDAGSYADHLSAALVGDGDMSQALLAEPDPCERLRRLAEYLQALVDSILPAPSRSKLGWN
jgi:uncharacterized protein